MSFALDSKLWSFNVAIPDAPFMGLVPEYVEEVDVLSLLLFYELGSRFQHMKDSHSSIL